MSRRLLSTSSKRLEQALVFSDKGRPVDVIKLLRYPTLPAPAPGTVNLRVLLSPINPADLNVIEGKYPLSAARRRLDTQRTEEFHVPGNECLATIEAVGSQNPSSTLQKGDWVIMGQAQMGTWCSALNVSSDSVVKLERDAKLSEVAAATLSVNPATAYCLLHHFEKLKEGSWIVQNGANSAVGQAIIQIAKAKGFKTLNLIRNSAVKDQLMELGATHVSTYDEMEDFKAFRSRILQLTSSEPIKLGLNCVSGPSTSRMAGLLAQGAQMVSYGAMSRQPFQLPTSLFIFQNITCRGFWMSRWYNNCTQEEMKTLISDLTSLYRDDVLREPTHQIITIQEDENRSDVDKRIEDIFKKLETSGQGKKLLLRWQSPHLHDRMH